MDAQHSKCETKTPESRAWKPAEAVTRLFLTLPPVDSRGLCPQTPGIYRLGPPAWSFVRGHLEGDARPFRQVDDQLETVFGPMKNRVSAAGTTKGKLGALDLCARESAESITKQKGPDHSGPSPCGWPWRGARVASLRCPIPRSGGSTLSDFQRHI